MIRLKFEKLFIKSTFNLINLTNICLLKVFTQGKDGKLCSLRNSYPPGDLFYCDVFLN